MATVQVQIGMLAKQTVSKIFNSFFFFSPLKTNVLVCALAVSILSCDCLLSKPFDGNTEHPTRTEPSLCRWKRPQLTCFLPEGRRERAAAAERFRSSSFHTDSLKTTHRDHQGPVGAILGFTAHQCFCMLFTCS